MPLVLSHRGHSWDFVCKQTTLTQYPVQKEPTGSVVVVVFSHPDFTVGHRISLCQPLNSGSRTLTCVITVGREFHPAPKTYLN